MLRTLLLFLFGLGTMPVVAQLRGSINHFEEFKQRFQQQNSENTQPRSLQTKEDMEAAMQRGIKSLEFFTVYDEFGPSISKLGQTAGLNGLIYRMESYAKGQLTREDVIGALKGSCHVVSVRRQEHFCTYEILLAENNGSTFGSVISSGSLEYKTGGGGFLIVEASGDAYAYYRGGLLKMTYDKIGDQTIVKGVLSLA